MLNAETGIRVAVVAEASSAPPRGLSAIEQGLHGAAGHGGLVHTPACTAFVFGQLIISVVADHVSVHTCDDMYRAGGGAGAGAGGGGASSPGGSLSPRRSSETEAEGLARRLVGGHASTP